LGVKDRLVLSDVAWERMAPLVIGQPDQKGSTGRNNRMFVEGVLWIVPTGSPWRDLPEAFRGVEQRIPALQPMEHQGCLVAHLRGNV
jgi:transposase